MLDKTYSKPETAQKMNDETAGFIKRVIVNAFKIPFPPGGTARSLIEHYGYGEGGDYKLNEMEMAEIYPTNDREGNLIDLSLTADDFEKAGDLEEGQRYQIEPRTIKAYAGTSGTLGNTTFVLEGYIYFNPETQEKEFVGVVKVKDVYDFNPSDTRPIVSETQVTFARNGLPGDKFNVYGEIAVKQGQNGSIEASSGIDLFAKPEVTRDYKPAVQIIQDVPVKY